MKLSTITSESWNLIIDRAESQPQGVLLYYKGIDFPRRVYYNKLDDPNFILRALNALGIVKKTLYTMTTLKSVVVPYRLSLKKWDLFLKTLLGLSDWVLYEWYISDRDFSVPVWEAGKFVRVFLQEIGFSEELAIGYSRLVMMILEFDNAYRYRLQDLAGVFNPKAELRKELQRVFNIYLDRELQHKDSSEWGARGKVANAFKLLSFGLYIPRVKRAFKKALDSIDLEKIKFDENDRCHISFWTGYDFEGKTMLERFEPYAEMFKNAPYVKRPQPKQIIDFLTE